MTAILIVKALLLLVALVLSFVWMLQMLRAFPAGPAEWRKVSPGRVGALALAAGFLVWIFERL